MGLTYFYLAAQFEDKYATYKRRFANMLPLKKDLKLVRQLHQKKFRTEHGLFFVEGKKMTEEAIGSAFELVALYTTDDSFVEKHKHAFRITAKEMEMMSALSNASQHLVVLKQPTHKAQLLKENVILVLDGIADPGNMGTIMRTADWFGIKSIVCTSDSVEVYNPKVVQSTMGSIFRMKVVYESMVDLKEFLKQSDFHAIGADMQGKNLFDYSFPKKVAIVLGSESHGLRSEMRELLNDYITIKGAEAAESLNASVAAGIIMAEWFRK
jgi:TrmH family RNA methyltransferase